MFQMGLTKRAPALLVLPLLLGVVLVFLMSCNYPQLGMTTIGVSPVAPGVNAPLLSAVMSNAHPKDDAGPSVGEHSDPRCRFVKQCGDDPAELGYADASKPKFPPTDAEAKREWGAECSVDLSGVTTSATGIQLDFTSDNNAAAANRTCVLRRTDWIHAKFTIENSSSSVINQYTLTVVARPLSTPLLRLDIGCHSYGMYNITLFFMLPACLGSTMCSSRFTIGPARQQMYSGIHEFDCTLPQPLPLPPPMQVPHALGFWHGETYVPRVQFTQPARPTTEDRMLHVHFLGDSTTEQIVERITLLRKHAADPKEERYNSFGKAVDNRCHYQFWRSPKNKMALSLYQIGPVFGTFPEHALAGWWLGQRPSLVQALQAFNHRVEQHPDDRHVMLWNLGYHHASVHASYGILFESSLLLILNQTKHRNIPVVLVTSPIDNVMRPNYANFDCVTEPVVRQMNDFVHCFGASYNLWIFDKALIQMNMWANYVDHIHLIWGHKFSDLVADIMVKAVEWVADKAYS